MVLNIITKGLRSKPVVALEKKMARRFRATRSRVLKDALLLRQLVNEIQVLNIKVRPVVPLSSSESSSDSGAPKGGVEEADRTRPPSLIRSNAVPEPFGIRKSRIRKSRRLDGLVGAVVARERTAS